MSRCTKEFKIDNSFITNRQFEMIMKAGSHLKCIEFTTCWMDFKNLEFLPVNSFKIKKIIFTSLTCKYNRWHKEPEKLFPLLEAISRSNLKKSLKRIIIDIEGKDELLLLKKK